MKEISFSSTIGVTVAESGGNPGRNARMTNEMEIDMMKENKTVYL
jgi:hypothetical protein